MRERKGEREWLGKVGFGIEDDEERRGKGRG